MIALRSTSGQVSASGTGVTLNVVIPSVVIGDIIIVNSLFNGIGTISGPTVPGVISGWTVLTGGAKWAVATSSASNVTIQYTISSAPGTINACASSYSGSNGTITNLGSATVAVGTPAGVSHTISSGALAYAILNTGNSTLSGLSISNVTALLNAIYASTGATCDGYSAPGTGASVTFTGTMTGSGVITGNLTVYQLNAAALPPDFSLAALPNPVTIFAGQSGNSTVTATPINSDTENINLITSSKPSGWTVGIGTTPIVANGGTSIINIAVPSGTTPGSYTVVIQGTGVTTGNIHTVTITVNVGSYVLAVIGSALQSVPFGTLANLTFNIGSTSLFGDNETVNLSVSRDSPSIGAGITASLSSSAINANGGTTNLNVSVPSTAPILDFYSITVTGVGASSGIVSSCVCEIQVYGIHTISKNPVSGVNNNAQFLLNPYVVWNPILGQQISTSAIILGSASFPVSVINVFEDVSVSKTTLINAADSLLVTIVKIEPSSTQTESILASTNNAPALFASQVLRWGIPAPNGLTAYLQLSGMGIPLNATGFNNIFITSSLTGACTISNSGGVGTSNTIPTSANLVANQTIVVPFSVTNNKLNSTSGSVTITIVITQGTNSVTLLLTIYFANTASTGTNGTTGTTGSTPGNGSGGKNNLRYRWRHH